MAEKKPEEKPSGPEHQTPSGIALAKVGEPKADASDEELVAQAEKYQAAKIKARRG
jgi:hypothetical protein